MTPETRLALEEAATRAWPPHETLDRDGWTLRFSGGGNQRANSVQCLRWTGVDIDAAIDAAEADYRARGLLPTFQILDVSAPADLDPRLAARGYTLHDATLLMVKSVAADRTAEPEDPRLSVSGSGAVHPVIRDAAVTPDWLAIYLPVVTPDRRATAPAIITALPEPKTFFTARVDGAPAAVGLGVAEPPWCGVECMATRAESRGKGGARAVMRDLERWAAEQGATTLWLQVLEANTPARRLYDGLGFTAAGRYWYRRAPGL